MHMLLRIVLPLLFSIAFLGFIGLIIYQFAARAAEREKFRLDAVAQFETWQTTTGAAQLCLAPGECEVVQESDSVGRQRSGPIYSYTLTRFLRNSKGEYFMFKSTPTGPYVKPVAPQVAKAVLKEKYVS